MGKNTSKKTYKHIFAAQFWLVQYFLKLQVRPLNNISCWNNGVISKLEHIFHRPFSLVAGVAERVFKKFQIGTENYRKSHKISSNSIPKVFYLHNTIFDLFSIL